MITVILYLFVGFIIWDVQWVMSLSEFKEPSRMFAGLGFMLTACADYLIIDRSIRKRRFKR